MRGKASKSMFVLLMIIVSSISTINLLPINAVDETNYYSNTYYVTEQKGDAYYLSGYEFRNNSSLGYLKSNVYDTYSGFKFTDVTISNTSIIDHAYLSLYSSDGIDNYDYMVTIYGEDIDSGNDFDTSNDLTGATLTSSYTNWNMKDLEGNVWRNSTDIKTSIQEIIDRGGWVSGYNVSLILLGVISANGYRSFRTWDYNGGHTYRAILYVEYHIIEAISSTNPWDSISGWDNHVLLNDTNGYTWWEVWNNTITTILAFKVGSYSPIDYTGWLRLNAGDTQITPKDAYRVGTWGTNMIKLNDTVYLLLQKGSDNLLYLYKSTDDCVTWSIVSIIGGPSYSYGLGTDGIDILVITYHSYGTTNSYIRKYTKSTNTLGANILLISGSSLMEVTNPLYIPIRSSFLCAYNLGGTVLSYKVYYPNNDTLTSATSFAPPSLVSAVRSASNIAGSKFYITWNDNYNTLYFVTVDPNTYAKVGGTGISIVCNEIYAYDITVNDLGNLGFVYTKTTEKHVYFAEYTTSWSGFTTIRSVTDSVWCSIIFGGEFGASYNILIGDISDNNNYIYSLDGSWSLIKTLGAGSGHSLYGNAMYNIAGESIHSFILTDPNGNIIIDGLIPGLPPTPSLMNTTIDDWLFKGEVYQFNATVQNTNEGEFNLTDGYHTMIFYYNNLTLPITQKVYTLDADGTLINEDVIGGIKTSYVFDVLNVTRLTWKFILGINVIDIFNTTITYKLVSWNTTSLLSVSISGLTNSTVNIYNLGGNAQYELVGDGSHIVGGHPFELEATNSSLISGGSYAKSWLVYRRLQYIHLLAELDMDNEVEAVEHFEPLVNIGYVEYGIDYKLEGEEGDAWIEGWKCRIYAQEINVGTFGGGNDMAYIKMYVFWYNRGDFIGGNEFYSYHNGYDITPHFPTDRRTFTFWVDLWFDKTNSSTVFGGRVNAEYYGYYEDGSAWWFNSAFRPMIGNVTSSMMLGDIKDADGNIVQSKKISLTRVTAKVAKTAPGMNDLGDVNTYKLRPYDVLEVNLATDRMEGINTPPIIDTGYLDIGGYGIWGFLIDAIGNLGSGFFNLTKLFLSSADTILSWFGLPYGTFSNVINFLSILPTMLLNFLNMVYLMFTNIINVIVAAGALVIFTMSGWVSIMLSTIQLISSFITIFISLFTGGLGTGVDIWNSFNIPMWLSFFMLLLPIWWLNRLTKSKDWLSTLLNDIELIKSFTHSMIGFFDWLYDKVVYIAQIFITLIRG